MTRIPQSCCEKLVHKDQDTLKEMIDPLDIRHDRRCGVNRLIKRSESYPVIKSFVIPKSSDFRTIDWRRDADIHTRQMKKINDHEISLYNYLSVLAIKLEGWIFAGLVAIFTAFTAAYVDLNVSYLSDIRLGMCTVLFWLDRRYCCGSDFAVNYESNKCEAYSTPSILSQASALSLFDSGDNLKTKSFGTNFDETEWLSWSKILGIPENHTRIYFMVNYLLYIIVAIILASLSSWLVIKYARQAAGSGLPEIKTILGGFVMTKVLDASTLLIKCTGLCLAVSSGLSLGKEGPMVHVACCWSNILSKLSFKYRENEAKKRELFSAASAAGVSVAFGAPLGGVLYALEDVSTYFPPKTLWKSFFCAVTASLFLKWLDPLGTGNLTLFQMDYISLLGSWDIVELVPFTILALIGGILGSFYVRVNTYWIFRKRKIDLIAKHPILEVVFVTLLTSCVNYTIPMLRESYSKLLEQLFGRCNWKHGTDPFDFCATEKDSTYQFSDYNVSNWICLNLLIVMILRYVQTIFTMGLQLPAGVFVPALIIGAAYGRLMGLLVIRLNEAYHIINCHKCVHPGVYALVGAISMLAGVTKMTISVVVIMFELTGGLSYVVPFMLVCIVSKWVGDVIHKYSIDDSYIVMNGYPYLLEDEHEPFQAYAKDIMEKNLVVISLGDSNTIESLEAKLSHDFSGYPIVLSKSNMILIGYILAEDLKKITLLAHVSNSKVNLSTTVTFLKFTDIKRSSNVTRTLELSEKSQLGFPLDSCKTHHHYEKLDETASSYSYINSPFEQLSSIRDIEIYLHYDIISSKYFIDISQLVDEHVIQLIPEAPIGQIYNIFKQLGIRICMFTRLGKLEGLLTKKAFLRYLQLAKNVGNCSQSEKF